ncbi:TrkH family potassium uptake protein [Bacteroidota bacterium]
MRYAIVVRILGLLLVFLSGAMLLPIPFSLYYGDNDYRSLLISAAICLVFGSIGIIKRKKKEDLRPKEGFAVVTLGWIVFAAFGALPFVISGAIPSYTDAFFETMSGFTTTGATILKDVEVMPHGLLFWRSLTHWFGGMGIIVLSLAILPFLGVGGMQLFKAESPGPVVDKLSPRITETAKILWGVYVLFSVAETVLLMFGGMSLFDALCHTFGTMATGGFSTKNASVGAYGSSYIDYVIVIFMLIAGTNFALHYRMLKGNFKAVWKSSEFRLYIYIILGATLFIGIQTYLINYTNFFETLQYTIFQVAAIITTTGFGTADYEQWSTSSQVILLLLMFIGGCAGSTGGGMKVIRIYILVKFVYTEIIRLLHPQAVIPVKVGNIVIERKVIANIAGFFILFMLLTGVGILIMSMMGLDFPTAVGSVVATINNIGPGIGDVGPTDNYAFIHPAGKWMLSFFMLAGRLEVFTVIILLAPSFWRK